MVNMEFGAVVKMMMRESMGGRIKGNRTLLKIFMKLPRFLFFFGQPDGKTLSLFLEGRLWKR
jgi:hypothetical protein